MEANEDSISKKLQNFICNDSQIRKRRFVIVLSTLARTRGCTLYKFKHRNLFNNKIRFSIKNHYLQFNFSLLSINNMHVRVLQRPNFVYPSTTPGFEPSTVTFVRLIADVITAAPPRWPASSKLGLQLDNLFVTDLNKLQIKLSRIAQQQGRWPRVVCILA